jgi:hypothetical protein
MLRIISIKSICFCAKIVLGQNFLFAFITSLDSIQFCMSCNTFNNLTRLLCWLNRDGILMKVKDEATKKSLNLLRGKANEVVVS